MAPAPLQDGGEGPPRRHRPLPSAHICGASIMTRTNVCNYERQRCISIESNRRLTINLYLRREKERRRKHHQQISHTFFFTLSIFFQRCSDSWTVPTPLSRQTDLAGIPPFVSKASHVLLCVHIDALSTWNILHQHSRSNVTYKHIGADIQMAFRVTPNSRKTHNRNASGLIRNSL